MSVGDSIRFFRKKAGLSQEELADILHIKKQTLSGYERGTREVRVSVLKPKVPSFYTKDYVGTGTSISS